MLTDYADSDWCAENRQRPMARLMNRIRATVPAPAGYEDIADYELQAKRDDAIRKLGPRWRGRAGSEHEYRNSFGVLTRPDALTEKTT